MRPSSRRLAPRSTPNRDRKSTRLNSSHVEISYAVFCLKKKNQHNQRSSVGRRNRDLVGGERGCSARLVLDDDSLAESFFFNDTATTEIYTLSLHDALPISLYAKS